MECKKKNHHEGGRRGFVRPVLTNQVSDPQIKSTLQEQQDWLVSKDTKNLHPSYGRKELNLRHAALTRRKETNGRRFSYEHNKKKHFD